MNYKDTQNNLYFIEPSFAHLLPEGCVQITEDEAEALRPKYVPTYKDLRAKEYPPIGDQLDALWKGGDAATEMLAKVQAVKNKYPKGTE